MKQKANVVDIPGFGRMTGCELPMAIPERWLSGLCYFLLIHCKSAAAAM
jgi:hypothetical protein